MQPEKQTQKNLTIPGVEATISSRRFLMAFLILLIFAAGLGGLAFQSGILLDSMLCLAALTAAFLLIFVIAALDSRLSGKTAAGPSDSYASIAAASALAWTIVNLTYRLSDLFLPVMWIAVIFTAAVDDALALAIGIYFAAAISITAGSSVNVLLAHLTLITFGVMLAGHLKTPGAANKLFVQIIYFLASILIPVVFHYLSYLELPTNIFTYAVLSGLANCLLITLLHGPIHRLGQRQRHATYDRILADDHTLVREIRRFSTAEFNHAMRVSAIAARCAELIGANTACARCAGFYYRLGKLEGEPEIDNALRIATDHLFPPDVTQVLAERGGILQLPSTRESAIVHIVDTLVTKTELLDADTMSSAWNQDMVIYQTLNELSSQGFYDESSLSINQFLKIREHLVQKESLL